MLLHAPPGKEGGSGSAGKEGGSGSAGKGGVSVVGLSTPRTMQRTGKDTGKDTGEDTGKDTGEDRHEEQVPMYQRLESLSLLGSDDSAKRYVVHH